VHPALSLAIEQIGSAELAGVEQELLRQRFLEFCRRHPDALHRSCTTGHLTGSAAVVDPARRAVLILHHVKLDRWLQPGGHADGLGDLAVVALTEAEEETAISGLSVRIPAIDLDLHEIPARRGEPAHLHLDVRFLVRCPPGADPIGNHESHDLAWWTPGGEGPQPDESTCRLLRRALEILDGD
jgi:hypothetical protein